MGRYVDVDGLATWVEERGDGDPVVLLHGGFGHGGEWRSYLDPLAAAGYRAIAPDRRGHGRTADTDAPFDYRAMAAETAALLTLLDAAPAHVVGWSDGANTGYLLALERPEIVRSLVAVAGNFRPDGMAVDVTSLGAGLDQVVRPTYERLSPDGGGHFDEVVAKTIHLWSTQPDLTVEDLGRIGCRTLVMGGDDELVRLDHLLATYEAIPDAELAIVPGATHGVLLEQPDLSLRLLLEFLAGTRPRGLFPVRRRPAGTT